MGETLRVLILGGSGMLGHKLWQTFRQRFDAYATVRGPAAAYERFGIFDPARTIGGVSAQDFESVVRAFGVARPAAVVNCIGVVKQDAAAERNLALVRRIADRAGVRARVVDFYEGLAARGAERRERAAGVLETSGG